jgi:hypothetical protein
LKSSIITIITIITTPSLSVHAFAEYKVTECAVFAVSVLVPFLWRICSVEWFYLPFPLNFISLF